MGHRRGSCVHFNGIQNDCCDAGINYRNTFGTLANAPCIYEKRSSTMKGGKRVVAFEPWPRPEGTVVKPCEKYRAPTQEEIDEDEREMVAAMERFRLIVPLLATWRTWTKRNRVGKREVVDCPACKGRLHLSQSAYNGHVHGQCETAGCVSWME